MNLDQAREYLSVTGIEIPSFMIEALLEQMKEKEECLKASYSDSTILLIYSYLLSLLALANAGRYIASQSVGGEVSRSFRYKDDASLWRWQLALLRSLDKKGCMDDLIPESPFASKKGFITSARGGCYE